MTKKGMLPIIAMVLVWASYYISSKYMVEATGSPYLTGMFLRGSALIVYTVILLINGDFKLLFRTGKTWYLLLLIGTLGFLLDVFANIGFKYSSASTGTLLLKLDVLMVNIVSAVLFGKKLVYTDWLFSVMMLLGVLLVLNINFKTLSFNVYDLFFIASAAAITTNAFIIKWVQAKHNVNSNVIGYYNNITVFVLFVVASVVTGDLLGMSFNRITSPMYAVMIIGGTMQCMIYIFYYYNLKRFEVWIVKIFLLFVPVTTTIASIFLFNERLSGSTIIGMSIVLMGALGIILTQSRKKGEIVK